MDWCAKIMSPAIIGCLISAATLATTLHSGSGATQGGDRSFQVSVIGEGFSDREATLHIQGDEIYLRFHDPREWGEREIRIGFPDPFHPHILRFFQGMVGTTQLVSVTRGDGQISLLNASATVFNVSADRSRITDVKVLTDLHCLRIESISPPINPRSRMYFQTIVVENGATWAGRVIGHTRDGRLAVIPLSQLMIGNPHAISYHQPISIRYLDDARWAQIEKPLLHAQAQAQMAHNLRTIRQGLIDRRAILPITDLHRFMEPVHTHPAAFEICSEFLRIL